MNTQKFYENKKINEKLNNMDQEYINIQNINNSKNENNNIIQNNINKMDNQNNNINLFNNNRNNNYNNNYINLNNQINNNQNNQNMELNNSDNFKNIFQFNNAINNNINNFGMEEKKLNPEDYLVKMFGRIGWICRQCNNFNFETRNKCNRCQAIKMPKTKEEINKKKEKNKKNKKKIKERKTDWLCLNCQNLNYGFRKVCNRCKIERKEEYPSIFLEPNQKINGNNNNFILMNNYNNL